MSVDPSALKALDHEAALARAGGDHELFREIAALFQQECPQVMGELQQALARNDCPAVGRAAHGLKGSAANFGAERAVDAALRIEQLARTGSIEEARSEYETLNQALMALMRELSQV
jgi:HPt (histidine-containing phosphotransfer) domain-containing protein